MKFFIATKNRNKVEEFSEILSGQGYSLICESDIEGKEMPDVEENGETFEENAMIKAKAGVDFSGLPSIADDSGLCVDFLNGEPGIYSARYAGIDGDSDANNRKLLEKLKGVPDEKRTARFVCAIACVFPDGRSFIVRGEVAGKIATAPKGNCGFGYDPIFVSEIGCFAAISPNLKNSISHRSRAIKKFKEEIKKY